MGRIYVGAAVLGCSMLVGKSALAQCQRDTDCKGARVCLGGQCVDRPAPAPAAAPAPAPMPAPAPQPAYAPQPQPQPAHAQPQPQPAYAPQPQPAYAPQPQPAYAQPQPQPAYAQPQPQPAYAQPQPQPGAAPATMGGGAAVGVGAAGAAGGTAMPAASPTVRLGVGTHIALSADRLFGFHHWSASATVSAVDGQSPTGGASQETSVSGNQIALFGGGSSTGYDQMQVNPYAVPRLGFDAVLNGGFSVGGSLIVLSTAASATTKTTIPPAATNETTVECPSTTAIGFAPRAGFVFMFNDVVGIWPRLGFTYITATTKTKHNQNAATPVVETEDTRSFISIDPEALLVITPVPHFGFTFGLQGSVGVSGSATNNEYNGVGVANTKIESDVKMMNIGLTAGLLGYL